MAACIMQMLKKKKYETLNDCTAIVEMKPQSMCHTISKVDNIIRVKYTFLDVTPWLRARRIL